MYRMDMPWLVSLLVLCAVAGGCMAGQAPACEDLDTTACQLFQSKLPGLCKDPGLSSTCKRFCGLCPLVCHDCPTAVNRSRDCPDTKACAADELCMLKQHSVGKVKEFIMTCEKRATCEGLSSGFHLIGKRGDVSESRDQRDLNFHCCNTDLCNFPGEFTTRPPTTTHKPTPPHTKPTTQPTTTHHVTPLHNCSKDIVFMLDGSSTIGSYNHNLLKAFVGKVLSNVRIGARDSLVAMVEYSDTARVEWYLKDHASTRDLQHAVSVVPYVTGTTATHAGFWLIRNSVLTATHGDRANAKDVVVLISDGGTNVPDLAISEANALRNAGVDIMVIAVGRNANADVLRKLARPPSNYIYTASYHAVSQLAASVASKLCML